MPMTAMCERCAELDHRIKLLLTMVKNLADPQTTEQANKVIEDMQRQKKALHPDIPPTEGSLSQ